MSWFPDYVQGDFEKLLKMHTEKEGDKTENTKEEVLLGRRELTREEEVTGKAIYKNEREEYYDLLLLSMVKMLNELHQYLRYDSTLTDEEKRRKMDTRTECKLREVLCKLRDDKIPEMLVFKNT